jgi:hypothetical protein
VPHRCLDATEQEQTEKTELYLFPPSSLWAQSILAPAESDSLARFVDVRESKRMVKLLLSSLSGLRFADRATLSVRVSKPFLSATFAQFVNSSKKPRLTRTMATDFYHSIAFHCVLNSAKLNSR